jgi:peroxiredoxin
MKAAGAFLAMKPAIPALTALFTLLLLISPRPLLLAQQDVHAALIAANDRKPAPAFDLANAAGKKVRISDYHGKVVLLNFWATDCGGCILEIPSFISIQAAHPDRAFTAVGVSMDIFYEGLKNADEAWGKVGPFVSSHKMNYPILMGDQSVSDAYGLKAFPATYLIDKSGRIAATYVGVVSKDNVEANVDKLLSER